MIRTQLQYSGSSGLGLLKLYQECYWGGCMQRLIRSSATLDLLYCYIVVYCLIPLLYLQVSQRLQELPPLLCQVIRGLSTCARLSGGRGQVVVKGGETTAFSLPCRRAFFASVLTISTNYYLGVWNRLESFLNLTFMTILKRKM